MRFHFGHHLNAVDDRTNRDTERASRAVVRHGGDVGLRIESDRLVATVVARHIAYGRKQLFDLLCFGYFAFQTYISHS